MAGPSDSEDDEPIAKRLNPSSQPPPASANLHASPDHRPPKRPAPESSSSAAAAAAAAPTYTRPPKKMHTAASKAAVSPSAPSPSSAPPPKRTKTPFELWRKAQQAGAAPPAEREDASSLVEIEEPRLRILLKLLGGDQHCSLAALPSAAADAFANAGAAKWARAERECELRERWKSLPAEVKEPFEEEAAEAAAAHKEKQEQRQLRHPSRPQPTKRADPTKSGGVPWTVVDCPEFGEGWTRKSRKRPERDNSGKPVNHVDHYFISPDGQSFNSRVKVLRHLGIEEDTARGGPKLSEEERQAKRLRQRPETRNAPERAERET